MTDGNVVAATEHAVGLRRGVLRPDWSAVTSSAARDALCARNTSRPSLTGIWAIALDGAGDLVWRCLLALFVDLERPPSVGEIAARADLQEEVVEGILANLHGRDLVRMSAGRIVDAYPFTERATEHVVDMGTHRLNALCAIDALGAGAMCGRDVTIQSRCRACGTAVRIATADRGRRLESVSPPGTLVWYDTSYEGSAASSCCPRIAFFCSHEHLDDWLGTANAAAGRRLSAQEAFQVGRAIFGPVLAEATPPEGDRDASSAKA